MTLVDPSSPAVALARESLAELRATDARHRPETGEGSHAWWVGRLAGTVETLLSVIDGPSTVPPAEVAP